MKISIHKLVFLLLRSHVKLSIRLCEDEVLKRQNYHLAANLIAFMFDTQLCC